MKLPDALHEVTPREQVGAGTGALYDYQYHQAAAQTLTLIDGSDADCVYCEWHDDYVVETAQNSSYSFHQVKTRQRSLGPWTIGGFFGLPKKKADPAHDDSIFARLWDHRRKFGDRCAAFVFVTDASVKDDFWTLLTESSARDRSKLSTEAAASFDRLLTALAPTFADVVEASLLDFLAKLTVEDGVGAVTSLSDCQMLIANRLLQNSEVDLRVSEARRIGSELVDAVRKRSHVKLDALPGTIEELRLIKGLVVDDVLNLISLSPEGYRQLKAIGPDAVRALSRLHRLCRRNDVPEAMVPDLCRFKTDWEAWHLDERHRIERVDLLTLKAECADVLRAHSGGTVGFVALVEQAKAIAEKHRAQLMTSKPLTPELVVGFVISIAVEAES